MSDINEQDESVTALVRNAIATYNSLAPDESSEHFWNVIDDIARHNDDLLEIVSSLIKSNDKSERVVAADIMGRVGIYQPQYLDRFLHVLVESASVEGNNDVQWAIAHAVRDIPDRQAASILERYAYHEDPDVRLEVATGLPHSIETNDSGSALDTLLDLTRDENSDVRDWATFGIGSLIDMDSENIRQYLVDRLDDVNGDVRAEAMMGLARRHDDRVLDALAGELRTPTVGTLVVRAASEFADRRLLPALLALRSWWDVDVELLNEAIGRSEHN